MTPLARLCLPLASLCLCCASAFAEARLVVQKADLAVPDAELSTWKPGMEKLNYQLTAELNDLDELAYWWPEYTLKHSSPEEHERTPAVDARMTVSVQCRKAANEGGSDTQMDFNAIWPQTEPRDSLVFLAWVQEGKVSKFRLLSPTIMPNGDFAAFRGSINMAEADTRGYPVLLLWSKGQFLKASPVRMGAEPSVAFRAAVKDDAETLAHLLNTGMSPNTRDQPVALGSREGSALPEGVSPGPRVLHDRSLADYAAGAGSLKCLALLKERKARFKPADSYRLSPLELAAQRGRTDVVRFLVASGVSPHGRDQRLDSPLYNAAVRGHLETVRALLELKADTEEMTHSNLTVVVAAINEGFPNIAELLLKAGASFDFDSENNRMAFLSVCREGRMDMARFYLAHGASAKKPTNERYALIEAAQKGSEGLAQLLLKAGAPIDVQDEQKNTALIVACVGGNVSYARALLAAGAKVSPQSKSGLTALHAAIFRGKYELVKELLAAGAPTDVKNRNGLTPFDFAVIIGAWECVDPFLKAGAKLDPKSPLLGEELDSILRGDQVDLLAQLLQSGVSVDRPGTGGWSLRRLAELAKAQGCAKLLDEAGAKLDETVPDVMAKASALDAGFKILSGKSPSDPRPEELAGKGASMKLRVLVDSKGQACFAMIDECADPLLCVGLTDTVKTWRFTPPRSQGKPVALWVTQEVKFPSAKERRAAKPVVDEMPRPIKQGPPVYPLSARKRGAMAEVVLSFTVDEKGDVVSPRVIRTSGVEFNEPALDCVRKWKFKPAKSKGVAVPIEMQVPIVFSISER